jgi:RNA polymerase sigma factor (sigma-70 family)
MGDQELQKILAGCRKDDRRDQRILYKTFYGFAMSICLRYAGNRYEASEIMNQGFLKVFNKLDMYDPVKPFKGWLGRIMINSAINYYHSNKRMAYMEDVSEMEIAGSQLMPDHKLAYDDLLAMVQDLPQAYRTVFNLYAIEGYNHVEISELLGISEGTSKSNLFRAREKLRKMVNDAARLPKYTTQYEGIEYNDNRLDTIIFKPSI